MVFSIIPHSRPWITNSDRDAVNSVLRSVQISQGSKVAAFEAEIAATVGRKEAVATSSGTSALHLALLALEVGEEDEVIIPSFVCTAVLNAVNYTGAIPRIVDIDPSTFNISPVSVAEAVTGQTKAIIVPHMFGYPAEIKTLVDLGIPVIEDCAQSIGASVDGKSAGSFGVLSVFSFYATKVLTSGEGGMVLGDSEALISKVRDLRDYDKKQNYTIRYNYKMTDMQAALGLNQLARLDEFIKIRKQVAARYFTEFEKLDISLPQRRDKNEHIYFRYVVYTEKPVPPLLKGFRAKGILCQRPVSTPLHVYLDLTGFPHSTAAWEQTLSIPLYPSLKDEEISRVVSAVKEIFPENK